MLSRCFFQVLTVLLLAIPTVLSTPRSLDHNSWFLDPNRMQVVAYDNLDDGFGEHFGEESLPYKFGMPRWITGYHQGHSSRSERVQFADLRPGAAKAVKVVIRYNGQNRYFHLDLDGVKFQSVLKTMEENYVDLKWYDKEILKGAANSGNPLFTLTYYGIPQDDLSDLSGFKVLVAFSIPNHWNRRYYLGDFSVSYEIMQKIDG